MSYCSLIYHIVFRPFASERVITPDHADDLYRYICGFVESRQSKVCEIGGMPDHIHLLVLMSPKVAMSDFMRDLKTSASKYMKDNPTWFPRFRGWGKSYCAITVSASRVPSVAGYIRRQYEHHTKKSYADEMHEICLAYGIEVDEKYFLKE